MDDVKVVTLVPNHCEFTDYTVIAMAFEALINKVKLNMNSWVFDVERNLNNMADISIELEQWRNKSIYRLPAHVRACNPQVVSFGPYHHGEQHLKPMEEHKKRALLHFLKRSTKPLSHYVEALSDVLNDLKDAYDQLDPVWHEDDKFMQLMILDGCFILEIMFVATHSMDDYAPNDPIFSNHGNLNAMPIIRRDMLLLENQVPLLVLERLLGAAGSHRIADELVQRLVLKFCLLASYPLSLGHSVHILDVYRKGIIYEYPKRKRNKSMRRRPKIHEGGVAIIPSATELNEAGIRFNISGTRSLKDISFRGNALILPPIVIDGETKSRFLNLMAFERFHVGAGNEVTSYAIFMSCLLKSGKDVSLLHSRGIVQNALGSHHDVARLFRLICEDVVLDPTSTLDEVYNMVSQKLRNSFRKRLNAWRSDLFQTYLKSPWAVVSVIAGIVLFTLTAIQTVYTVLSYTHPK